MSTATQHLRTSLSRAISRSARVEFQPFWDLFQKVAHLGLGCMNANMITNGEVRALRARLDSAAQAGVRAPVVFDVGAHDGEFAKHTISISSAASVYCFEPHPGTFNRLEKLMTGLDAELVNCAVGASENVVRLVDRAGSDGTEHARVESEPAVLGAESSSFEVRQITLDQFAKSHEIDTVHYCKIDVEGYEAEVLRGMEELIRSKRVNAIAFEFGQPNSRSGETLQKIAKLLPGYKISRILPNGLRELRMTSGAFDARQEIFSYSNYLATPEVEVAPVLV